MIWLKICIVGVVVVVFTFCAFCADVWADTIYLKDGSVIKGKIEYTGEYQIQLKVDTSLSSAIREVIQKNRRISFLSLYGSLGIMNIPRSEISKIEVSGVDDRGDSKDREVSTPAGSTVPVEALIKRIEALKAELEELKTQVKDLQARIEKLEGKGTKGTMGTLPASPRPIPPKAQQLSPLLQSIVDDVAKGIEADPADPQDIIEEARKPTPTTTPTVKKSYYIGNSNSLKFHHPDCQWAKKISPANRVEFKSKQDAINRSRGF